MRPQAALGSLLVLSLVVGPVAAAAPGAAGGPGPATGSGAHPALPGPSPGSTTPTITLTQTLRLTPRTAGEVESTVGVTVPDNVASLTVRVPTDARVLARRGFSPTGEGGFAWDGTTPDPTLTLAVPANETGQVLGPEGAAGDLVFADTGEWAIVRRPEVAFSYEYFGTVRTERDLRVEGPGVAGRSVAYLGPAETVSRTAHGQTFTLVVPEAASMVESRGTVLDSLTAASDALRVGERDEAVLAIAAPTAVPWAVEGLEVGGSDFYVTADERVDDVDNVWLHEYVHTRQDLGLGPGTEWFTEASATYYAALFTLEQDRIGFPAFEAQLEQGGDRRFRQVVLAEPATWTGGAQYWTGALVAGDLDRRLRRATERRATLQRLFGELNAASSPVTRETFLGLVDDVGGAEVREAARRYTGTTDRPTVWSVAEHGAVFGTLPARVEVALPAPANRTAWRATGPYRNVSVGGTAAPALVTGETLVVDVPVTNSGGTAGDYAFAVTVDGTVLATRNGTVGPDRTVWESIALDLDRVGTVTLGVAGATAEVVVAEPADLTVADLTVNRTTAPPGGAVAVRVTVANPADRPGRRTVTVSRDGTAVATRTVFLDAGERTVVEATLRLPAAGAHEIVAGTRAVTVRALAPTTPSDPTPTGTDTAAAGPGLGVPAAVLALVVLVVLAGRGGRG